MLQDKRVIISTTSNPAKMDLAVIAQINELGKLQESCFQSFSKVMARGKKISTELEKECEEKEDALAKFVERLPIDKKVAFHYFVSDYPSSNSIAVFHADYYQPHALRHALTEDILTGNFDVVPCGLHTVEVIKTLREPGLIEFLAGRQDGVVILQVEGNETKAVRKSLQLDNEKKFPVYVKIISVSPENLFVVMMEQLTQGYKFKENNQWHHLAEEAWVNKVVPWKKTTER